MQRPSRFLACCRLATLIAWAAPSGAAAQTLELQLREEIGGKPVAGAIVRLLRDAQVMGTALSSEQGRVSLRAPGAGSYRVRVDRIGWTGVTSDTYVLAAGETLRREIVMASTRLELPTIVVKGKSQCGLSAEDGSSASALWDEIRKALTANVITQRQGAVPLLVRGFTREVDRGGKGIREWYVSSSLVRGQPFASLPPVALAKSGFVITDPGDSVTFAAPDAALLLSDEFVGTHCFRAVPGKEGLIGLGFEPVSGRRLPDVEGTLWVTRETGELSYIEYGYTGLTGLLAHAELGGRLEFRRLPNGAWIVGYWHIRAPRLGQREVHGRGSVPMVAPMLAGYTDLGGRAEIAADDAGHLNRALIAGRIYDSVAGAGLAGAVVKVVGTGDSVLTDSEGRFFFAVAASGDRGIVARHPRLGLLREPTRKDALLSIGDTVSVEFGVPSISTFARTLCGSLKRGRSGVVGLAFGPDGRPADGLELKVQWLTATGGSREESSRSAPSGLFAFCDLPPDRSLPVRLMDRSAVLGQHPVQLEWGSFSWVEVRPTGTQATAHPPHSEAPR